jgi:hypothetical protein
MISHVILLNHGRDGKVNQQLLNDKYLVLNAPWHGSPANTILRIQGCEIYVESKDVVCRILNVQIVHLETVYSVDKAVEFVEIVPSPPLCDFFLAKRYFLDSLSRDIRPDSRTTGYLERRRPMRFVIPVLLYLFLDVAEYLLVGIPEHVIRHITNQPIGVKQNTAIKTTLGALATVSCSLQRLTIRLGCPVVFVNNIYLLPTHGYLLLFSSLYSTLTAAFVEVIQLLNNSSYNPLKKRRDSIILSTDQIFMSVVMFSFYLLIIMNVICFHAFFVFMNLCLISLKFASDFVSTDTSHCSVYTLVPSGNASGVELRYTKVSIWTKVVLATEASFRMSALYKDKFLINLLLGTQ